MANPGSELLNQVLTQATNVRAFGGGMASNVVRLTLTERSKGRQATHIQSVGQGENRDYFFYARMSMGSAASVAATQSFCKAVSSEMRARWTKSDTRLTKLLIPRILLNVDRNDDADDFRRLHQWMRDRYRAAVGAEFNDAEFASISIVEGTTVVGLLDHMIAEGRPIPHMHEHLKVLGVLHALDVALGMGDRLQNPNPANITVNPATGQLVLIDMDTFLPPLNCHKVIQDACRFTEKDRLTGLSTSHQSRQVPGGVAMREAQAAHGNRRADIIPGQGAICRVVGSVREVLCSKLPAVHAFP